MNLFRAKRCLGFFTLLLIISLLSFLVMGCDIGGSSGGDSGNNVNPAVLVTWYEDSDSDGYGDPGNTTLAATQPMGYVSNSNDCNDTNQNINPVASEICGDGIDQNCSGSDLQCSSDLNDVDNDGDGYTENQGDCNDSVFDINPAATEICGDGIDQDCNGSDLSCDEVDNDTDGYTENQGDCDDANAAVNPGVAEIPGNLIDDNCNGITDEVTTCNIEALSHEPAVNAVSVRPNIFATFGSICSYELDTNSIVMRLDGNIVGHSVSGTGSPQLTVSHTPSNDLIQEQSYTVRIYIADEVGNSLNYEWTFFVPTI